MVLLCSQHHAEDNVAALRVCGRIRAPETEARLLKNLPPVPVTLGSCVQLGGEATLWTVSDNHFSVSDGLRNDRLSSAQHCEHWAWSYGDKNIRRNASADNQLS